MLMRLQSTEPAPGRITTRPSAELEWQPAAQLDEPESINGIHGYAVTSRRSAFSADGPAASLAASYSWYPAQAKANPDLFRAIFDFNCSPQFWLHERVHSSLPHQPVIQALSDSRYGARHLSRWLIQELHLVAQHWHFEEIRLRLYLLSVGTLYRLARYCAAALTWPRIAAVIGRVEIHELKAMLGEDAHAFAMRRARFIVPQQETVSPVAGQSLGAFALSQGWGMLLRAAMHDSEALSRRLALKLPTDALDLLPDTVSDEQRHLDWTRVQKISKEVLTEGELKCFA